MKTEKIQSIKDESLKAKDLRIGNLVNLCFEYKPGWFPAKVTAIYANSIDTDTEDDEEAKEYCYDGIPLSSEWLLKAGFENRPENLTPFHFIKIGASILQINPDNGVVWINNPQGDPFNNPQLIEYVHQLQNLYFALTGEELIFKNMIDGK